MTAEILPLLQERIALVHEWLLAAATTLTPEPFAHRFSPHAPPIGWHLWHIARFADRLQSRLAVVTDGDRADEYWVAAQVASQWGMEPADLGVLETGMGQLPAHATRMIVQAGQANVIAYVQCVFDRCEGVIGRLTASQLGLSYFGILDYESDPRTGAVWATGPRQSLVAQDLIMHAGHASRHLGAMEGLRGLLGNAGTVSV